MLLVCLLPISSVWLGLGLGCVAGHNYNQQRSPEQGKVVTERWRLVNYVVNYVCRDWGPLQYVGRELVWGVGFKREFYRP